MVTLGTYRVKNVIVDLPIKMKGNSKCCFGNSSNPLVAQNKDIGTALQMLLRLNYVCDAG